MIEPYDYNILTMYNVQYFQIKSQLLTQLRVQSAKQIPENFNQIFIICHQYIKVICLK